SDVILRHPYASHISLANALSIFTPTLTCCISGRSICVRSLPSLPASNEIDASCALIFTSSTCCRAREATMVRHVHSLTPPKQCASVLTTPIFWQSYTLPWPSPISCGGGHG